MGGLALSTLPPPGWGGLAGVTALAVLHRFDLGANAASLLFPRLTRLIIRDEGTLWCVRERCRFDCTAKQQWWWWLCFGGGVGRGGGVAATAAADAADAQDTTGKVIVTNLHVDLPSKH